MKLESLMGMHQALKKAHLSPPATGCQPSWAGSGIPRIPRPVWLWVQTGLRRCRGKLGRRRGPAALLCSEGWGGSRVWPLLGRRSTPPRPQQLGSSRWVSSCTFSDAWACDFCGTGHIFSSRSPTSSELHGTQAWLPVPVADSG